ncbi:Gene, complete cds (fragment) [Xenorhabdus bovienii str. feltiae Florida]
MTLIEHLSVVKETRSDINRQYDMIDVIFLVVSAIMAGAEGWQDIETYGRAKMKWLKKYRPFLNGIPRLHTIARILRAIELDSLLEALLNWVNEQREVGGKPVIAFDGKVLRRAYRNDKKNAVQLVTAYDTEAGLVLSQKATATKNGEISLVRQMLDILNLKGSIVTLDALHCQRETLEKISEKKAHVVVQVKKNQPLLWKAVQSQFQAVFDVGKEQAITEIKQKAHGRREERYVFQLKPNLHPKWQGSSRLFAALLRLNAAGHKMAKGQWIPRIM